MIYTYMVWAAPPSLVHVHIHYITIYYMIYTYIVVGHTAYCILYDIHIYVEGHAASPSSLTHIHTYIHIYIYIYTLYNYILYDI